MERVMADTAQHQLTESPRNLKRVGTQRVQMDTSIQAAFLHTRVTSTRVRCTVPLVMEMVASGHDEPQEHDHASRARGAAQGVSQHRR